MKNFKGPKWIIISIATISLIAGFFIASLFKNVHDRPVNFRGPSIGQQEETKLLRSLKEKHVISGVIHELERGIATFTVHRQIG